MSEELEKFGSARVNIRLASAFDARSLAQARFDFRSDEGALQEKQSEFVERCALWMRERLGEGSPWRCWIAERERVALGNLWAQLIEKIPNPAIEPERHAYITNFYVREEARGRGIGTMLLSAALEWCRDAEVHAVVLWPTKRSRALYLRHGFAAPEDLLELILGESRNG
jgi:GNAT superfamily N-acetyltransferase